MSSWLDKVSSTYRELTGYEPTNDDLDEIALDGGPLPGPLDETYSEKVKLTDHFPRLIRFHKALDSAGIGERGRLMALVTATGYTKQQVSRYLNGVTPMRRAFILAASRAFNLDVEKIIGDNYSALPIGDTAVDAAIESMYQSTPPQQSNTLDAPMREMLTEMRRLSEANRWLLVGKIKGMIQEFVEEQESRQK